ncbi:Bifunctional NAD(P)H-hydrate repair enzyme Nnr [Frondihabitans sp. 762G35]|uniref:NAD(P)H-hydrate epimerase n=1 Tax=Frondihabitans sp. 762G35 TaxID=1446794 RepID=UPI000D20D3E8|nr:NAD(P)H-hydrate epimerase [Frondihabitans sp. 762G35]ARC57684.1 Bifunctional NAD(P)H-hydrate repair enzyme Nnr [Frondihabitans sp. 762G35]
MILGYTADQVRAAEAPLLARGERLMERAAMALADEIRSVLARRGSDPGAVLVLAGSGDNGGDALFAAASLASRGVDVRLLTTGLRVHEAGLAAAAAAGVDVASREAEVGSDAFAALAEGIDVIVDGILGIGSGSSPALRGRSREVVETLRPSVLRRIAGAPGVVAVDLPSGIDSDDGSVPDPCVLPALVTVTFGAVKAGLLLAPASGLAGRIRLVDIGLGPGLEGVEPRVSVDGTL